MATRMKKAVQMLVETSKNDVRSVTDSNFRNIMHLVGISSVDDVTKEDADKIKYSPIEEADKWKIENMK